MCRTRNACGRKKKLKRVGRRKQNSNAPWNVHEERLRREDWQNKLIKSARHERLHLNQFVE